MIYLLLCIIVILQYIIAISIMVLYVCAKCVSRLLVSLSIIESFCRKSYTLIKESDF